MDQSEAIGTRLARRDSRKAVERIYLAFLAIHILAAVWTAMFLSFPTSMLDEWAHYSYIEQVRSEGFVMPGFDRMQLIELETGDFSEEPNYLNHPPLYHALLAPLAWGDDLARKVMRLRIANAAISTLAVGLLLFVGYGLLTTLWQHALFAAAITLCPKIGMLGGIINNDNLALLGGAIVIFGLTRLPDRSWQTASIIGVGFVLGALTKLTAGLGLGLMIAVAHAMHMRWPPLTYGLVLAAFAVAGMAPYLKTLVALGSPIYIGHEHFLAIGQEPVALGLWQGLGLSFGRLFTTWPMFQPGDGLEYAALASLLALAAAFLTRAHTSHIPAYAMLALAVYIPIHLWFIARNLTMEVLLLGVQFRYILPLWPALALAAALGLGNLPRRLQPSVVVAIILLMTYGSVPSAILRAI